MGKILPIFIVLFSSILTLKAQNYNLVWNTPSQNSSESMPCGGGDIGLNVWVEDGDVLFYIARSNAFDENNSLLKLGRVRIRFFPNPFDGGKFSQELKLDKGCVIVRGEKDGKNCEILFWVDVFAPVIHVEVSGNMAHNAEIFYENWRYADRPILKGESEQCSWKWTVPKDAVTYKDSVMFCAQLPHKNANADSKIIFFHKNKAETIFDTTVKQQGLEMVKDSIFNPLKNLVFGGRIYAKDFVQNGISEGKYADTDFRSWNLRSSKPLKNWNLRVELFSAQSESNWSSECLRKNSFSIKNSKESNLAWWRDFWNRSFIRISGDSVGEEMGLNYSLCRYMLACNAYGEYPTRFNGGLFSFDPCFVDSARTFTPDFRRWTGGTYTAQNQRLVYYPMLRSGDFDMMISQFDFYLRILQTAEIRSRYYWGHGGACFEEQIENFGLPNYAEYGTKRPADFPQGLLYNAWLEYSWDTVLEFCFMILDMHEYSGKDISKYFRLIDSSLRFFDTHYQHLARQRGAKSLDGNGKLVLYPGSGAETYKMAYNATSTIAALKTVINGFLKNKTFTNIIDTAYYNGYLKRLPELSFRKIDGRRTISPALHWERVNNTESPQLYPVYPWGMYGIGQPDLETAINTWKYDPDVIKFRSHIGWKQDAIWAARLGLTDEAWELTTQKMSNGKHRFPAFWGPGYDWTPDFNHGGSGMIALQEMLLQTVNEKIYLLPAWDKNRNVHFKLHAPQNTTVECEFRDGQIVKLEILPIERAKDVIFCIDK